MAPQAFMKPEAKTYPYHTALHAYIAGKPKTMDAWVRQEFEPLKVAKGTKYKVQYRIAANDGNFPVIRVC
jgi:hypothetical protein